MAALVPKVSWGAGCDDTYFTASSLGLVDVPELWGPGSSASGCSGSLSLSLSLLDTLPAVRRPPSPSHPKACSSVQSGVSFCAQVFVSQPTGLSTQDGHQDRGRRGPGVGVLEGVCADGAVLEASPSPGCTELWSRKGVCSPSQSPAPTLRGRPGNHPPLPRGRVQQALSVCSPQLSVASGVCLALAGSRA